MTITEHPATPTTPAYKVTELHFTSPTEWQKFDTTTQASTGKIDTSVAEKRIEVAAAQPLLYAAILAGLGAVLFVYLSYPTPALLCGAASALFFLSWKLSDLPPWVYLLGVGALAGGAFLYFGHEKGLKTTTQPTKT